MATLSRLLKTALWTACALSALSSACFADGLSATATYTDTQIAPGLYDYTLTLNNTGTTTIGTFWFSWIPGAGFLSVAPTNILNPAGWSDKATNSGAAIQWTTSTPLGTGGSLSGFSFDSTEAPAQLLLDFAGTGTGAGDPVTTSFVYIAAPLGDPGYQFVAVPAAATPEPQGAVLLLSGLALLAVGTRMREQINATH